MRARTTFSLALAVVGIVVACDFNSPPTGPGTPALARLVVIPDSVMLDPQQTQRFQALGLTPAGDTVPATVNWQVSGGSITASGTYTADTSLSDVTVTATVKGTQLAGAGQVKKRRLVQIVVTPATVSLPSGGSQQFAAYGRRNTGDSVPVSVSFSATGGTITSSGMYSAGATPGAYRVSARESTLGLTDTVAVSVTAAPPPPGNPGTVTNLAVSARTDTSFTLSFTDVTDGTGQPASYELRWSPGTIAWGSATPVARGTCATPVAGGAIGATTACTVLGLAASTGYQLQVVAFRGTLNVDAVFGALSNIASDATSASTAPVASVTVSPAAGTVGVGQALQLAATLKDASGNTLTGRTVTWSSGAPLLGGVSGSGLVSGLAAGLVSITATSEGINGSASITVTALLPPPTLFTNEPAGLTVIQETDWSAGLGPWFRKFISTDKPITVVPITDSPLGDPFALQLGYNAGSVGGGGTELEYDIAAAQQPNEIFMGYYVQVDSTWQGHSSAINKMVYFDDGGSNFSAMWYEMFGSGTDPLSLYVVNQSGSGPAGMHENVTPANFTRGQWHKVEIYQKQGSPGIVRVWVDGALAIDRSDVFTNNAPIDYVTISGIWGGVGDTKAHFDYMRFDHVRISGR